MKFQRRDTILLAGAALMAVGMIPFTTPALAIAVAAAIFLGIKWYSARRQRQAEEEAPLGLCAECGEAITESGCPQCSPK